MHAGKTLAGLLLITSGTARSANFTVTANANLTFTPSSLTIQVGDTVTWQNIGGGFHNVEADDNSFTNGTASSSNWTFSHTFTAAGTVGYHCAIHIGSGMVGQIVVGALPVTLQSFDVK